MTERKIREIAHDNDDADVVWRKWLSRKYWMSLTPLSTSCWPLECNSCDKGKVTNALPFFESTSMTGCLCDLVAPRPQFHCFYSFQNWNNLKFYDWGIGLIFALGKQHDSHGTVGVIWCMSLANRQNSFSSILVKNELRAVSESLGPPRSRLSRKYWMSLTPLSISCISLECNICDDGKANWLTNVAFLWVNIDN